MDWIQELEAAASRARDPCGWSRGAYPRSPRLSSLMTRMGIQAARVGCAERRLPASTKVQYADESVPGQAPRSPWAAYQSAVALIPSSRLTLGSYPRSCVAFSTVNALFFV